MEHAGLPTTLEMTAVLALAIAIALAMTGLGRTLATGLGRFGRAIDLAVGRPAKSCSRMQIRPSKPAPPSLWHELSGRAAAQLGRIIGIAPAARSATRATAAAHTRSRRTASHARSRIRDRAAAAVRAEPQRLSRDDQWARAADVVGRGIRSAHTIRAAQSAASEKLDVANYAMEQLRVELAALATPRQPVMAEVHQLAAIAAFRRPTAQPVARAAA